MSTTHRPVLWHLITEADITIPRTAPKAPEPPPAPKARKPRAKKAAPAPLRPYKPVDWACLDD